MGSPQAHGRSGPTRATGDQGHSNRPKAGLFSKQGRKGAQDHPQRGGSLSRLPSGVSLGFAAPEGVTQHPQWKGARLHSGAYGRGPHQSRSGTLPGHKRGHPPASRDVGGYPPLARNHPRTPSGLGCSCGSRCFVPQDSASGPRISGCPQHPAHILTRDDFSQRVGQHGGQPAKRPGQLYPQPLVLPICPAPPAPSAAPIPPTPTLHPQDSRRRVSWVSHGSDSGAQSSGAQSSRRQSSPLSPPDTSALGQFRSPGVTFQDPTACEGQRRPKIQRQVWHVRKQQGTWGL